MSKSPIAQVLFHLRRDHAIRRCAERFNVRLDHNEYAYLNRTIRRFAGRNSRKAKRIGTLQNRRAAYQIQYKGKELIAVYSHHHHQIITFLTRDQITTAN